MAETQYQIYLRGELNGWGTPQEHLFTYEGNGIYSLSNITLSGEFKFATSDWSSVDLGAYSSRVIQTDTVFQLGRGGSNLTTSEIFCARIELNINNSTVYFYTSKPITYPDSFKIVGKTNNTNIDMINIYGGVFTYTDYFKEGTYYFTSSIGYSLGELTSASDSPFSETYSVLDGGSIEYAIPQNGKFRFYIDLLNKTFKVINLDNIGLSAYYLLSSTNNFLFSPEYRLKHEYGDFFSLENVMLKKGELCFKALGSSGDRTFGSDTSGTNVAYNTKLKSKSTNEVSYVYNYILDEDTFFKRIELFIGASSYVYFKFSSNIENKTVLGGIGSNVKRILTGSTEVVRCYIGKKLIFNKPNN